MTWTRETSNGNESFKVRYDVVPYAIGRGLDIGCGPWKIFQSAVGVDSYPYAGPSGPNVLGDARNLEMFANEYFDWVYSSHTLEDIEDTAATLREWWRVLRPGGNLILYLPHKNFYPNIGQDGANPAHKHDFMPADIIGHMRALGFDWELVVNEERDQLNEYSFLQVYRKGAPGSGQVESWDAPKPEKTCAVVRYGAHGDALWASSVLPHLKAQGYHITVYTQKAGELMLRHDPHIDRFVLHMDTTTQPEELVGFWTWHSAKFDRWLNLVGSVETELLPAPTETRFWLEHDIRHKVMDRNYLETVHDYAGVPHEWRQKFYPTPEEVTWAQAERAKYPGRLVVINPSGSTAPKFWPYAAELAEMLAADGVHCIMLGETKGRSIREVPNLTQIGTQWDLRKAITFAALADIVVGVESVMVNAVAFERPLKVVILGHSSAENLTKHWPNTVSVEPGGLGCYPCHRLHPDMTSCVFEKKTQTSACHAVALPEKIAETIGEYWKFLAEREAA